MKDENKRWSYDIATYERCVLIVSKLDAIGNKNNRQFWVEKANDISDRYPSAKLSRIS